MALLMPNSVFIHVPKTGGSWVRAAIQAAGVPAAETGPFDVHDHCGGFDLPGPLLLTRFSFGFVRHPVDWIKSRWAWAVRSNLEGKCKHEPAACGHWISSCFSDQFSAFVERYLETCPGIATETMLRMSGWAPACGGWNPTPFAVSFIGRQETLQDDLVTALTRAGESFDQDAIARVSPKRVAANGEFAESCRLSTSLERRILRAEAALCNLFDYE